MHADSLTLFALNIEMVPVNVTNPKQSNIPVLTWPAKSSVTSRSNSTPCLESSRTGLSIGVWISEISPVVWEILGGGGDTPLPPIGCVTRKTLMRRGLKVSGGCAIPGRFYSELLQLHTTDKLTPRPRRSLMTFKIISGARVSKFSFWVLGFQRNDQQCTFRGPFIGSSHSVIDTCAVFQDYGR